MAFQAPAPRPSGGRASGHGTGQILACGRPGALVQLMRHTLFLVVDSAAGMSAVVAHHSSGIGDSAEFARTVVNGGHARSKRRG
jgi:hypothetical protein